MTQIQEWAGHTSITTTSMYMHFAPKKDDAERLSRANAPVVVEPHRNGDDLDELLANVSPEQLLDVLTCKLADRR